MKIFISVIANAINVIYYNYILYYYILFPVIEG